jgi:c-di-GMP-binding flagellar brake protein YcgR
METLTEPVAAMSATFPVTKSDRRSKARFPIQLDVCYHVAVNRRKMGTGQTVDVSSAGMLIRSSDAVSVGAHLHLVMPWPFLLHGTVPLQLAADCRVVRCEPFGFAVVLERYQFRTMKRGIEPVAASA